MRELAIKWWKSLYFVQKWEIVVKHKEHVIGYPDRNVDSFSGSEVEKLYKLEQKP